jgi:hypothetical protein
MRKMLWLMVLAGCSSRGVPKGGDMTGAANDMVVGGGDLASGSGDMTASQNYPAGPYGHKVGDTISPLTWEGYADPLADAIATQKPFGSYSMNDLRLSGRPYAAIHVSDFY